MRGHIVRCWLPGTAFSCIRRAASLQEATPDWIRKTSSFCWLHPRYIWLLISQTLKRQFKLSSNARLAWKAATCTVPIR